jgi:hypothetical protein
LTLVAANINHPGELAFAPELGLYLGAIAVIAIKKAMAWLLQLPSSTVVSRFLQ